MAKVRVENLTKVFNKHTRNANNVLKSVSFELPEKGLVAIFGKSGSGKTTLLNIIGGLERQDGGKVYIDGKCTNGRADKIRNAKTGFIFQNYYLESGYTIEEILHNQLKIAGFKDKTEIEERTAEALKLVDMERYKHKQGNALSGGQKQRVAIARALVKGADIILADEPTGNLDAENTLRVMEILKEISKTKLVVLVTHEITLIEKYADSRIKIVDGKIVENGEIEESGFSAETYSVQAEKPSENKALSFTGSGAKRNGRLFTFGGIFRYGKNKSAKSAVLIVKQIFIFAMAAVICYLSSCLFGLLGVVSDMKAIDENSLYLNLNAYTDLRSLNASLYEDIDFFETEYRSGSFSYENISSLSDIEAAYGPAKIEEGDSFEILYGEMPEEGEILITRALAETLKSQTKLKRLKNDEAVLTIVFDGKYGISGITEGDEPFVYFNKTDYVNFLGVYGEIGFSDADGIFFSGAYAESSYTAEIRVYDGALADDMVIVELNRNSLYLMMDDTTAADYTVQLVNAKLNKAPYSIQISDSLLYVKSFTVTRDVMTTDIAVYVNATVMGNIFRYLKPGTASIGSDTASERTQNYYFKVSTSGGVQLDDLSFYLSGRGVNAVDVMSLYERQNAETMSEASENLVMPVVIAVLLMILYYFTEKSGSIASIKEYGVFRAIGVNRTNLLFKEIIAALVNSIAGYFIFNVFAAAFISVYYAVSGIAFGMFLPIAVGTFAVSAMMMLGISLIPYLFVLYKTPAQILAKYDI